MTGGTFHLGFPDMWTYIGAVVVIVTITVLRNLPRKDPGQRG